MSVPPPESADPPVISADLQRLLDARHHDPFELLGRHTLADGQAVVRALVPHAAAVSLVEAGTLLQRIGNTDLFQWVGP
ncbi:MAG: hypothetical protein KJ041_05890, partial [Gammaproteobacteria bacterium]|nr:hypothetical protein [Gammaproteobacteria bacterium]